MKPAHERTNARFAASVLSLFLMLLATSVAASERVIEVLADFESSEPRKTPAADALKKVELSDQTEFGKACLKVTLLKGFDWNKASWNGGPATHIGLCTLSGPHLPPEADAVRLKVKVLSGRAVLSAGGPVNQLGCSDVLCNPQLVEAGDKSSWQTVDISLNAPLTRNFRRANFTKDLPVIYYTRWAQEPMSLNMLSMPDGLMPDEDTVLLIDQVELVAKGDGKPFPKFAADQVKPVSVVADFSKPEDRAKVCTFAHGYSISKAFEAGYRRKDGPVTVQPMPDHIRKSSPFIEEEGFHYPAPRYSAVEGQDGRQALRAECLWAEEGQIVTVKTAGDPQANAFRVSLKPHFPNGIGGPLFKFQYEGKPAHVVDFVVFVAPKGSDFPWNDFSATDELKKAFAEGGYTGPGGKYDYMISAGLNKVVNKPRAEDAGPFGFYFARRFFTAKEWSEAIVPFADFVCVYGQGACKDLQAKQLPLDPAQIAAIGFIAPYGSNHGTIDAQSIEQVAVPGAGRELQSYWQIPDRSQVRLLPIARLKAYGGVSMMTLDADVPAYLLGAKP